MFYNISTWSLISEWGMGKAWETVIEPSESSSRVPKIAPIKRPVQSSLRL